MKKTFFLLIVVFLVSCHDNVRLEVVGDKISSAGISQCIKDAFAYFIEHEDYPDTSYIYSMEFLTGVPGFPLEDTMIGFYMMSEGIPMDNRIESLKGYTIIDNYLVLVFDSQNIGKHFYNSDSLKRINFDSLKFPSVDIVECCAFVLNGNDHLELVGIQPDDFVPIKINR